MSVPKAPLIAIAEVIRGVTFKKDQATTTPTESYVPVLRAGNIGEYVNTTEGLVWVPRNLVADHQLLRTNDVAICMSSGSSKVVGKSAQLKTDWQGAVGAFLAVIRPTAKQLEPEYLAHYLRSPRFRSWTEQAAGANIKNIRKSELEGFEIPLPPLPEQRRIVEILNHADSIRRLRRQAEQKAREIIPALFIEMFGDPVENPRGWETGQVGDYLALCEYGTSQKASTDPIGLPVLRMGNVSTAGDLLLEDLKYIDLSDKDRKKYLLQNGDLLFNRTNSKDLVGKTGIWDGRYEAVPASYFIRMRADRDRMNPWFLWAYFNTKHMKGRLFETARGAIGQANINARELKGFSVYCPPIQLQDQYQEHLQETQASIDQQTRMAETAEATLQALMGRYFDA